MRTALFTVLLLFTHSASALWVKMTECELVNNSELIVLGEYIGESQVQLTQQSRVFMLAAIRVEALIKGKADKLIYIQQADGSIKSSSDIDYSSGQKGLWFLKKSAQFQTGIFLANHPQRFKPVTELETTKALISACQ